MKWSHLGDRAKAAILLAAMALTLSGAGVLTRIDHVLYDAAQRYAHRDIPPDIALVAIDEQSLSALGRWPWPRQWHAKVIERLHADGARVIGMDVMFVEPQTGDPEADRMLTQAIAKAGNVVLPVVIEQARGNGQLIETLPLPELAEKAAALGRVHAELDGDAIARSITLWEGLGVPVWPHFAQSMLTVAGQLPPAFTASAPSHSDAGPAVLSKSQQRYINFSSNRQHIPSLSYEQVLRGEFKPGTFKGKLVLLGATAAGMADSLPTPVSGHQQPMPGVEFLANALISMRSQTLVTQVPGWLSAWMACMAAITPMLWLPRLRASMGLLCSIAFALTLIGLTMALPVWGQVWVPLSAGIVGVLSAYPIWAWRKLEAATQFLDAELGRLQHELQRTETPPMALDLPNRLRPTDPFQRRIEQVRAASAQLQHLENAQRETLAFISHDIRVPLASAAAQVKGELGAQHPAYGQLARALAWTEDYLQNSRAQMLNPETFTELDVVGLLHEVADEAFPLVKEAGLQLDLNLPDHPAWVYGHHETLSRALLNLISNAIKFSPAHAHVGLCARQDSSTILIQVADQGPGIPPQDMDRLFQRFSRPQPLAAKTQNGVGLGLYFVQTTVRKHQGLVQISSQPGHTVFSISLPSSALPPSQDAEN